MSACGQQEYTRHTVLDRTFYDFNVPFMDQQTKPIFTGQAA